MPDADRGPVRSVVHRLTGDERPLPVEGRLASFDRATSWLNAAPLTPDGLRGRVVLVDFWTYTCVNWLRTLPYVRAWDATYREHGLTVVGVHTPEFGFEHDVENIEAAVRAFDVRYPVAVDSDYGVWRAFDNHYWPAVYLADAEGSIRYHHFGEGEYATTEMALQQLLVEAGATSVERDLVMVEPRGLEVAADWRTLASGETYLGYGQASGFTQEGTARFDATHEYVAGPLGLNEWALSGTWTVARHASLAEAPNARIAFRFRARDVNLVMGPAAKGATIGFRVLVDGEPAVASVGSDVGADATGTVDDQRTYQLIRQTRPVGDRLFEIEFASGGVEAYCFTFG